MNSLLFLKSQPKAHFLVETLLRPTSPIVSSFTSPKFSPFPISWKIWGIFLKVSLLPFPIPILRRESLGLQGDPTSPSWRRSVLAVHGKDWCWSWNSNSLATACEELTHWKRPWCWEGLGVGGEGDDRGWDGWMASPTRWTWVWVKSGSWWWTGRPGVLQFMGSQRVGHDWVTELKPILKHLTQYIVMIYLFITSLSSPTKLEIGNIVSGKAQTDPYS